MPPRKVTIEDISKKTELSRGTVSRALNDRPDISQATKRRVLAACRELSYVPSHAARSLATGRNYAVTVVVDRLDDPLEADYLRGVLGVAERHHYGVYVLELGPGVDDAARRLRSLSAERYDAVLICSRTGHGDLLAETLEGIRTATILPTNGLSGDVIGPDWLEAGRIAGRFLSRHAGGKPTYLHRPSDMALVAGVRELLEPAGLNADEVLVVVPEDAPWDQAVASLRLADCRAIAAATDTLAIAAMAVAASIGEKPAVLGCGNAPIGSALQPALSTIDLDGVEIGRLSMETILDRIGGARMDASQRIAVAPRPIWRGTASI
jgi:LacI family transcriptional regulator